MRAALSASVPAVRRYLFGIAGDWHEAEDLAQEAMLKAWAKRASFDGRANVRTWIFAIARNHWRDRLRRRRSAPSPLPIDEGTDPVAADSSPVEQAERGEVAAAIAAAMDRLPPVQREALALRESKGLTFAQIADVLGVPAATAKSRVRQALLKLAEMLRPLGRELGS